MNYIHQYVYDKPITAPKRQKVGVVAAVVNPSNPDEVFMGWSKCNQSPFSWDRFDKTRGIQIAVDRALVGGGNTDVPASIIDEYMCMYNRAVKYFKDKKVFGSV